MFHALQNASIPTWLRIKLQEAAISGDYVDGGYHLGRYHLDDFCEDSDIVSNLSKQEVLRSPTLVLRRLFVSEAHPTGELTDLIPEAARKRFLVGLLAGACEEEPGDPWLSLLETT